MRRDYRVVVPFSCECGSSLEAEVQWKEFDQEWHGAWCPQCNKLYDTSMPGKVLTISVLKAAPGG